MLRKTHHGQFYVREIYFILTYNFLLPILYQTNIFYFKNDRRINYLMRVLTYSLKKNLLKGEIIDRLLVCLCYLPCN